MFIAPICANVFSINDSIVSFVCIMTTSELSRLKSLDMGQIFKGEL